MTKVRIQREEPLLQKQKKPQTQCLLGIYKEPLLQSPDEIGKTMSLMHLRDQEDTGVQSPDPYMFNSTIWVRHDHEESARMYEDPMDRLRDRVFAMEHNLESLRTRLAQVADLRDAQGIREDHRAIIARLNKVEECATVHTLREFMSKIRRLEAMFTGENGGAIVEAIRACNRRLDSRRDTMDDFHARISTQDWYHDISDQEGGEETENQPGVENRSSGRRRNRGHAPQRRMRPWTRTTARPPPPSVYDAPPTQDMESSPRQMIVWSNSAQTFAVMHSS